VDQLEQCQRVLALTELAALRANHQSVGGGPPRVRRRWTDIRRGARAARRRAASAPPRPAPVPPQLSGPPPAPLHDLARDGEELRCRRCDKSAKRARWSALAYGRCSANVGEPSTAAVWQRVPHCAAEAGGVVSCERCRGSVPAHRRAAFIGRRCPAWWAATPSATASAAPGGGQAAPAAVTAPGAADAPGSGDWGAWIYSLLGHAAAGAAVDRARSAVPRGARRQPAAAPPPAPLASTKAAMQAVLAGHGWRPHAAACGPRLAACLQCGASAPSWGRLAATPCGNWVDALPPRVAALVHVGGGLACAGGSPVAFATALRRRLDALPAAPD
jgi:hypothetical protein